MWYLMYLSLAWSYWLTLLLALPTAGLLVRIFAIQHDCGHRSFFHSQRANDLLGTACSLLTLTPYHLWRRTHSRHHASSGDLNHRGHGDIAVLTVDEYLGRSKMGRLRYRLYRNPFVMFVLGSSYLFIVQHRFTFGIPRGWRRERIGVYATNAALLAIAVAASLTIGLSNFLLVHVPLVVLGAAAGSWLFYVQHQFEHAYWQPHAEWDFTSSALEGSSYYRLPVVLQWFTGNIGFHHIHHLDSRIPNYNLAACHASEPEFQRVVTLGLRDGWSCMRLKLWDARKQRMVTFSDARAA
jgi:omega-6 fatty acid desaturase (delta-12 desaturase)